MNVSYEFADFVPLEGVAKPRRQILNQAHAE